VYKMHRESYHLTMDFIDRYLSCMSNVPKQHLQLIGMCEVPGMQFYSVKLKFKCGEDSVFCGKINYIMFTK
jgi:hypothetical protein